MAVVGLPSYFQSRNRPRTPPELTQHNCINLHLPTHGGSLYAWDFEKSGREVNVRVEGQLVFNSSGALLHAALQGLGLACPTEGQVQPYLSSGELSECWRTGARRSPDITSTISAAGSRRRLFAAGRCPSLSREITTLNTFEELQSISAKTRRSPRLSRVGLLRPSGPTESPALRQKRPLASSSFLQLHTVVNLSEVISHALFQLSIF